MAKLSLLRLRWQIWGGDRDNAEGGTPAHACGVGEEPNPRVLDDEIVRKPRTENLVPFGSVSWGQVGVTCHSPSGISGMWGHCIDLSSRSEKIAPQDFRLFVGLVQAFELNSPPDLVGLRLQHPSFSVYDGVSEFLDRF